MKRFVLAPRGGLVLGVVISVLVGIAVFGFGAPPLILLPAALIPGTVFLELQLRALNRSDRH